LLLYSILMKRDNIIALSPGNRPDRNFLGLFR
jgi:hypothetical protein